MNSRAGQVSPVDCILGPSARARYIAAFAVALLASGWTRDAAAYDPQPIDVPSGQTYAHEPSGMMFPPGAAGFHRVSLIQYDAGVTDVSGGYNFDAPDGHIVATVFVYPAPPIVSIGSPDEVVAEARATMTKKAFEQSKGDIEYATDGARLMSEGRLTIRQNAINYSGWKATYGFSRKFMGKVQPLSSELYLLGYVGGEWLVMYRFTYPEKFPAKSKISDFMSALTVTIPPESQ